MQPYHTALSILSLVLVIIFIAPGCHKASGASENDSDSTTAAPNDDSDTTAARLTREECIQQELTPYTSLDLLLVVDTQGAMSQITALLSTGVYNLLNGLTHPVGGGDIIDDVRIGVVTSDMGVSYGESEYDDEDGIFDNAQVKCAGMGDNARLHTEFAESDISLEEGIIVCDESAVQCPPGWTCENLDDENKGVCSDPNGDGTGVSCPASPSDLNTQSVDSSRDDIPLAVACLLDVGVDGCNYEQQLKAATLGLKNNDGFVRADSLTAVIIVSDEEDCSIASDEWHKLEELQKVTANLACRRHSDLLLDVADLKATMEATKIAAGGEARDLVFTAITGVPADSACETTGDEIGDCFDIKPEVNGNGTMSAPDEVARTTNAGVDQYYFEYACQRYADGDDPNDENVKPVLAAFPGTRYVKMAELFGERGYVHSICDKDWTPAMENIATIIRDNVKIVCKEP